MGGCDIGDTGKKKKRDAVLQRYMSNKKKHMQEEKESGVGCWIMYPTTGLSLRFWRMSTSTIPFITLHTTHLFFSFSPTFLASHPSFSSSQHYFSSFNSYLLRIMREIIHVQAGKLKYPITTTTTTRSNSGGCQPFYSLSHGSRFL